MMLISVLQNIINSHFLEDFDFSQNFVVLEQRTKVEEGIITR